MRTLRLSVDDLMVRRRTEHVPARCECGADLTSPRALKHWEYQDQQRSASIASDGIDWSDSLPSAGETFLACSWICAACVAELLAARELHADPGPIA
jgi:hypothetical protein